MRRALRWLGQVVSIPRWWYLLLVTSIALDLLTLGLHDLAWLVERVANRP